MGVADIICNYIYGSFKLIKAALEVLQQSAKALLKALDTLFNTLLQLIRTTIDIAIKTTLDFIRVIQKYLVSLFEQFTAEGMKKLCNGLFKCTEFIEEILDPSSLLSRTMKKFTNYNQKPQQELYKIVGDFKEFKNQICNFGFTFNFGLSAVKSLLNSYESMVKGFLNILERNKERIRRFLQKYLDFLIDMGVFDMLDRVKNFFDCVILNIDSCTTINTANSFYNTYLNKLKIQENGNGYKINSEVLNEYTNAFDSRIVQLSNISIELQKLVDSMLNPIQVKNASKAFSISTNIFPGGMSWTDIKKGRWSKNNCYHYFKMERRAFINAFKKDHSEYSSESTDFILNGMTINDKDGIINIKLNNGDTTNEYNYNSNDLPNNYGITWIDCDIEYLTVDDGISETQTGALLDENTDEIISTQRAAIKIAIENDEQLKNQCQKYWNNVKDYTKDSDLTTSW